MKSIRNHLSQLIRGFIAFIIVLVIALIIISRVPDGIWRQAVLLLPVIPVLYIGFAISGAVRQMDELQRRIQLEAFAFSLATTSLITFTIGLMSIDTPVRIEMIWVLPMAALFWSIGLLIATRRY